MFFLGTSLPIYSTWAVRIHDQNITPSFSFCSPFLRPDAKRSEVELISLAKKMMRRRWTCLANRPYNHHANCGQEETRLSRKSYDEMKDFHFILAVILSISEQSSENSTAQRSDGQTKSPLGLYRNGMQHLWQAPVN